MSLSQGHVAGQNFSLTAPKVRTGWPDHCQTGQFENEIGFLQRVFAEKPFPLCILFRI